MNYETANSKEIEKFSEIASEWWDPNCKFKPLHKFNPLRLKYIKDNIDFNDFVGKDEDYIKNEIPGVGKPTAKKILEIVEKQF